MEANLSRPPSRGGGSGETKGFRRAISLVRELTYCREGSANLTQLAKAAGLPKPTVHRIVGMLLEERLVERVPDTRNFRLGPLVYELGIAAAPSVDVRALCTPSLERLAAATGDTAFLNGRSGEDALCLDRREGSVGFQAIPVHVGNRRPLGLGASSLAILATLPTETVEYIVAQNADRYSRHRLTADRVLDMVASVRSRGFALTSGSIIASFRGVAISVDRSGGGAPLALSIIALSDRLTLSRIDEVVALLQSEEKILREKLSANAALLQI